MMFPFKATVDEELSQTDQRWLLLQIIIGTAFVLILSHSLSLAHYVVIR
jgi:hypothetical protein